MGVLLRHAPFMTIPASSYPHPVATAIPSTYQCAFFRIVNTVYRLFMYDAHHPFVPPCSFPSAPLLSWREAILCPLLPRYFCASTTHTPSRVIFQLVFVAASISCSSPVPFVAAPNACLSRRNPATRVSTHPQLSFSRAQHSTVCIGRIRIRPARSRTWWREGSAGTSATMRRVTGRQGDRQLQHAVGGAMDVTRLSSPENAGSAPSDAGKCACDDGV